VKAPPVARPARVAAAGSGHSTLEVQAAQVEAWARSALAEQVWAGLAEQVWAGLAAEAARRPVSQVEDGRAGAVAHRTQRAAVVLEAQVPLHPYARSLGWSEVWRGWRAPSLQRGRRTSVLHTTQPRQRQT
jgi:hypothetical protein